MLHHFLFELIVSTFLVVVFGLVSQLLVTGTSLENALKDTTMLTVFFTTGVLLTIFKHFMYMRWRRCPCGKEDESKK